MAEHTHLKTEWRDGVLIAEITTNSLSDYEASVVQQAIIAEAPKAKHRIVADLAAVKFMSSAGLGMLVSLHKVCKAEGGKFVCCNICAEIMGVLKMTHLDKLIPITSDRGKAIDKAG
jgi:anti-anti-sigma factor